MSRRDWFRSLQFYPALLGDSYLTSTEKEKAIKAANLTYLSVSAENPTGEALPALHGESSDISFLEWLEEKRKNKARRIYALPANFQEPLKPNHTPFEFLVGYQNHFETYRLVEHNCEKLWQIDSGEFKQYTENNPKVLDIVKSYPYAEHYLTPLQSWLSSNLPYVIEGRVTDPAPSTPEDYNPMEAFGQHLLVMNSYSLTSCEEPRYLRAMDWLDAEIKEAFKNGKFSQEIFDDWNHFCLDQARAIKGSEFQGHDFVLIKTNESAQAPKAPRQSLRTLEHQFINLLKEGSSFCLKQDRPDWARKLKRALLRFEIPVETDSEAAEFMILLKRSHEAIKLFTAANDARLAITEPWDYSKHFELDAQSLDKDVNHWRKKIQAVSIEAMIAAVNEGI